MSDIKKMECPFVLDKKWLWYWKWKLVAYDKLPKLKLTGDIHIANSKYLKTDTVDLNKIRKKFSVHEILFEGLATVSR